MCELDYEVLLKAFAQETEAAYMNIIHSKKQLLCCQASAP